MIASFSDLLAAAASQPEPQRLLFLFASADGQGKAKGKQRGTLQPLMCVDKLPAELDSFRALADEADQISRDWDFVFIAGLNGANGQPPSSEDAEPHLNQMVNDLMGGHNMARYVVLDRQENPVMLQAG
ncbi:ribonucleotide reductase subunit alpha [Marinobacterium aestuariivivens]|uniref:Ribonucleotide reductase subunit alpha n=1 Tax=Marinobacterium aestuariivivens TaxID=1698799 RepID=A0ABW2A182_9GAMM